MQPRAFRLALQDVIGSLGQDAVQIVNISRTGALLRAPTSPPVGSEDDLGLRLDGHNVDLKIRVVRTSDAPDAFLEWLVAVEFVSPTDALEKIKVLMSRRGA